MKWHSGHRTGGHLVIILTLIQLAAPAATATPDFTAAREILLLGLTNRAYPGCAVTVGNGRRVLWAEALGHLDYTHGVRVTRTSIYDLASLTKVAGTTAVYMRLVALDKVNVHEPVSKYLPEFIEAAASEEEKTRRQKVSIEHLLTHTGGLSSWKPFYKSVDSYPGLLNAIFASPLESEPGKQFSYSDLGMILAGEIASRLGGKPLVDLERDLVFAPLGMSDTLRNPPQNLWVRIAPTERLPDRDEFVHGIVHDENARAGEGITGHAGLFSTADDLGKLAAEWLRALDGRSQWFRKDVVQGFFAERKLGNGSHRTLGWGLMRNEDGSYGPTLSHTGFTGTAIWMDPEKKSYAVLLSNRVHPTRDHHKINEVRKDFIAAVMAVLEGTSARESK